MSRILTGIQSSGKPHLGNLLGAIRPAISHSKENNQQSLFFIADLHSLTSIKDAVLRVDNLYAVTAAWLAFGLDTNKDILFAQSHVPMVTELAWYLNCFTPFPMLASATSFKDKVDKLSEVNAGLFSYPVLMAADILLYDATHVPVGKDQRQHLEITRDIARSVNAHYHQDVFVIPEAVIEEKIMTIPGKDGAKMSKSYNNYIDIFVDDKSLLKSVKGIVSDSKTLEDIKDPATDVTFQLFSVIASASDTETLRQKYVAGNFGYGSAKQALFDVMTSSFKSERLAYNDLISDTANLKKILLSNAEKAESIALPVIKRVRKVMGFGKN